MNQDHHGYPAHPNCKVCQGTGYFTHSGGKDACQSCEELFEAEFLSNIESKHELSENQAERP